MEFGDATVHRHHEVDVGKGNRVRHSLHVVLIVYPEVGAGSITTPANCQIEWGGLNALCCHLEVFGRCTLKY